MTLVVLAKAPVAGRVKTRMCPPCSPSQAAALAAAALADTLDAVSRVPARRHVLALDGSPDLPPHSCAPANAGHDEPEATPALRGPVAPLGWVLPPVFETIAQRGGGLDERLAAAFDDVGGPVLLVGMDTPQVTSSLLVEAAEELLRPATDAVLGTAPDGGWWAVGLRRPDPQAFLGVPMSTPVTGIEQWKRLDRLGLRSRLLPCLEDADDIASARSIAAMIPGSWFATCLASLGLDTSAAAR